MHENEIARHVVDCCFKLHSQYGPGVFEEPYELMLVHELAKRGIACERQLKCPLVHDGILMKKSYKIDVLAANKVVLELKSIDKLEKRHFKQVQTYLKLKRRRLGLLINFGENLIKDGIHRIVNGLDDSEFIPPVNEVDSCSHPGISSTEMDLMQFGEPDDSENDDDH